MVETILKPKQLPEKAQERLNNLLNAMWQHEENFRGIRQDIVKSFINYALQGYNIDDYVHEFFKHDEVNGYTPVKTQEELRNGIKYNMGFF